MPFTTVWAAKGGAISAQGFLTAIVYNSMYCTFPSTCSTPFLCNTTGNELFRSHKDYELEALVAEVYKTGEPASYYGIGVVQAKACGPDLAFKKKDADTLKVGRVAWRLWMFWDTDDKVYKKKACRQEVQLLGTLTSLTPVHTVPEPHDMP